MKYIGLMCIFLFTLLTCPHHGVAQQKAGDLSQQAANPIANLMSFPFQNNIDFGLGGYHRTRNVLNIQPVIPLVGGKIITRMICPIVWMPDVQAESGLLFSGLSDITLTAFYVPGDGNVMWGVGPVLAIPTGGSNDMTVASAFPCRTMKATAGYCSMSVRGKRQR